MRSTAILILVGLLIINPSSIVLGGEREVNIENEVYGTSSRGGVLKQSYQGIFGLDNDDTVGDYKNAPLENKYYWLNGVCMDGECLLKIDWACGFTNGLIKSVHNCINNEIFRAEHHEVIGKFIKRCGRRHMITKDSPRSKFERAILDGKRTSCMKLGGGWQVRN
jgi:hypothetical protein